VTDCKPPGDSNLLAGLSRQPGFETNSLAAASGGIRVALIDCLRFSRDCLIRAVNASHTDLLLVPFASISDCICSGAGDIGVIVYCSHDDSSFENVTLQEVKALRQAFTDVPVIVLSDAKSALQPKNIRKVLNSGAKGFIPTLTTEMPAALAAIRFVRDGGTFAPVDLLLAARSENTAAKPGAPPANRLTRRQLSVLSHLRQGKANKIIAHDLGVSESTVKVHVRNIMRKMGATNRTQAVYNLQQFGSFPCNKDINE
jgi:DNA-binding NarL/FixJ family response regulator